MNEIILQSFCKINIGLKIVSKREDGLHNIHTVFQEIDFHDTILLKKTNSGCHFKSNVNWLRNDQSNLCVKAWEYLEDRYYIPGVHIELQKNIPPGSGLGGGSSNAASILKGISDLYNLNIPLNDLCLIGSSLGADVPFFIKGGCQIGNGIGDELIELNNPFEKTQDLEPIQRYIYSCMGWRRETYVKYRNDGFKGLFPGNMALVETSVLAGMLIKYEEDFIFIRSSHFSACSSC